MTEITDEDVQKYMNETLSEELIRNSEDTILVIMKFAKEKYPSEKNDKQWLNFSNFVCKRRYQMENEKND